MKHLFLYILIFLSVSTLDAQNLDQKEKPKTTRILFLLDGSGSMAQMWGDDTRINIAKELLKDILDSLKNVPNLQLGFRAYGHQHHKVQNNCTDTKLEVPFSNNNHEAIKTKLDDIKPMGVTPLAYSLEQATSDFDSPEGYRNVIIIITDGLESCQGDPCAISLGLQKNNIFLKPFIIGIGMNENFANQFDCIGKFYNAESPNMFKTILEKVVTQTLSETKIRIDLLDIYNEATETNVPYSIVDRFTDITKYDLVHHKMPNGKSESVDIDPILSYNVVVHTIPKVIKKDIDIDNGHMNVIEIKTPQGTLQLDQKSHIEYGGLKAIVRKKDSDVTLHVQDVGSSQKYLVGKYDIEVLTLPRTYFKDVKIDQSAVNRLEIDMPGKLSVQDNLNGYGAIYEITDKGESLIYSIGDNETRLTLAMQPGKYKIVFRSKNASSHDFTAAKTFTIISGKTTTVKLFTQ